MSSISASATAAVQVASRLGEVRSVRQMLGGASLRRFFRIEFEDGSSAVLMHFPDAQTTGAARLPEPPTRWPFLEIQETLANHEISVPQILAEDCESGWLIVEDLGADCLADYLERHPENREEAYRLAVRQIARAQGVLAGLPDSSVIFKRSFDFEFLFSELEHFLEYGLVARGYSLSAFQEEQFRALGKRLCERIVAFPYGFSHRDYQSRNLMVREPLELTWIDFQDASLGPRVYDLVALLQDSYQSFDREFIDSRLAEYAVFRGLTEQEALSVRAEFDCVTVQRKLKDAGRFVFIEKQKHDASYLKFVEPTLALVTNTLRNSPDDPLMSDLLELLLELGVASTD